MKHKVKITSVPNGKTSVISPFPNFKVLGGNGTIETNNTGTNSQDITTTVKPVDREHATIEAEKGELILKPDLQGIYKIGGKKHSQGGTPLAAQEGSFIFSDDATLAISAGEKTLFNFKKGSKKSKDNTPAKIALSEVDPKEYNMLVSILNDPKKDIVSKNTAALMLAKYQEKLGQIALVQEGKKGLPNGLPDFAADAPMSNAKKEAEMDMYSKGGLVKFQLGGGNIAASLKRPKPAIKQDVFNQIWATNMMNPFAIASNSYNAGNRSIDTPQGKRANGMFGEQDWDLNDFRSRHDWYFQNKQSWDPKNSQDVLDFQSKYNGRASEVFGNQYFTGDSFRALDGKFGEFTFNAPSIRKPERVTGLPAQPQSNWTPPMIPKEAVKGNPTVEPPKQPGVGEIPWEGFDMGMTGLEMLTGSMPALQAFATPTQYAMLQQKYTPNARFDRVDNSAELEDITSQSALAQREMFGTMNANQAAGNMDAVRANEISNVGQSNARRDQANIPIGSNEAMYNQQNHMKDADWNMDQILMTYDKNVLANQRRVEGINNGINQSLNNFNDIETNIQAAEFGATQAALPYLTHEKNADGSVRMYEDKDGNQFKKQGVPFGFTAKRMPKFQPGFGSLDSYGVQSQMAGNSGVLSKLMTELDTAITNGDTEKINALSRAAYSLSRNNSQQAYQNPFLGFLQGLKR
jgi:hypothetical protein